jgi:hypothetical protein
MKPSDLGLPMRRPCHCKNRYCSHWQAACALWATAVATGDYHCWRCGQTIPPNTEWDGGHDDDDVTIWRGPEHRAENRATSTRRRLVEPRRWTL